MRYKILVIYPKNGTVYLEKLKDDLNDGWKVSRCDADHFGALVYVLERNRE